MSSRSIAHRRSKWRETYEIICAGIIPAVVRAEQYAKVIDRRGKRERWNAAEIKTSSSWARRRKSTSLKNGMEAVTEEVNRTRKLRRQGAKEQGEK
jgi:hypothetical protein